MPTLSVAKDCLLAQGQIKQSKRGLVPTPSYWLILIDWLIIVITNFGLRNSVTIDWLTTVITNFWLRNSVTKGFLFIFEKCLRTRLYALPVARNLRKLKPQSSAQYAGYGPTRTALECRTKSSTSSTRNSSRLARHTGPAGHARHMRKAWTTGWNS